MSTTGNRSATGTPSRTSLSDTELSEFIAAHGDRLLAAARRYSSSPADAEDAYQRALTILLTKPPMLEEGHLLPWMLVVTRNEALMIGRSRMRVADTPLEDFKDLAAEQSSLEELAIDEEDAGYTREALRRLKPAQARCLLLLSAGMSYAEIGETTGLSPTKVHRYVADGRKQVRRLVEQLGTGRECRRVDPLLMVIADGEADDAMKFDAGLHLDNCAACRATLREYRAIPRRVEALLPVAVLEQVSDGFGFVTRVGEQLQNAFATINERLTGQIASFQSATDFAAVKKAAAVSAIAASAIAGGVTVEHVAMGGDKPSSAATSASKAASSAAATEPTGRSNDEPDRDRNADSDEPRAVREGELLEQSAGSSSTDVNRTATPTNRERLFVDPAPAEPQGSGDSPVEEAPPADDPNGGSP